MEKSESVVEGGIFQRLGSNSQLPEILIMVLLLTRTDLLMYGLFSGSHAGLFFRFKRRIFFHFNRFLAKPLRLKLHHVTSFHGNRPLRFQHAALAARIEYRPQNIRIGRISCLLQNAFFYLEFVTNAPEGGHVALFLSVAAVSVIGAARSRSVSDNNTFSVSGMCPRLGVTRMPLSVPPYI